MLNKTLFFRRGITRLFPVLLLGNNLKIEVSIFRQIATVLLLGILVFPSSLEAQLPGDCSSPKTSPVAGSATVDLNYTEWSLANDFYACMYRAGNPTKPLLSKTYMRHDCSNDRVYVLVLVESGVTADMSPGDAWVRVPAIAGNSVVVSGSNQPAGTAFSWVYDNGNSATGTLMGFEAYFTQTSPFSDDIEVHLNTDGGETSSTGKISQNNAIPFSLACGTACIINIDKIIASGCSGGDHDLDVRVNYNNAPPGSDIEIVINSTDVYTFTPTGGADGCQIFAVSDISCSGALTVEARFKTNTGCSDMVSYTPMSPPTDPQGFIYCEEIGEIIAGGTIELVVPNVGTVIQVHANGSSGEYAWDVLSGPVGEFSMLYNPPTGYALSTLHTPTPGTIDLTTYNGGSDIFLGQDANAAGTALVGFNPTTYQGDNPFYLNFSIDYGDPNLFLNNIPLSGCVTGPPACPTCATVPDKNTTGFEWLSGCDDPATFTQTKNMTGNATWDDANTTFLGFKPSEFYNGNVIKINGNGHTLTIPNSNLIIDGDGRSSTEWPYLVIENLTLEIENGNFQMIKGARVIARNCTIRVSGDIQQQSAALHSQPASWLCVTGGYIECGDEQADGYFVSGASSPTSANFQNDNGKRYLNQVCFNVTQSLQQTTNTYTEDLHVSVCAEIGDQGPQHTSADPLDGIDGGTGESGNMDIRDKYTTYNSTYHITSGNFSFGSDSDSKICDAHYKTNDGYWDLDGGIMTGCTMCVWARDEDGPGGQFIEQSGSTYSIPDNTVTWRATSATNAELPGGLTTADQASLTDIQACMPSCCSGAATCAVSNVSATPSGCSGGNYTLTVTFDYADAGTSVTFEAVVGGNVVGTTTGNASGTGSGSINTSNIACGTGGTVTVRVQSASPPCEANGSYSPPPPPPPPPCSVSNLNVYSLGPCVTGFYGFVVSFDYANASPNATFEALVNGVIVGTTTGNAAGTGSEDISVSGPTIPCGTGGTVIVREQGTTCQGSAIYTPTPSNCSLVLDKVIATACSGSASSHSASVKVTYANAPLGEDIEIVVNGVTTSFTPAGSSGTETFNVSGISCAGLVTVTARFETTTACSDVLTYTPSPNPPIDPQGFIYCEETGEIIAGGTIEVVAPNNGTVVQINLDGSNGEYDWDVIAGPGGDFNMIYNPPTGYALSTLHTASAGPLDITTANGGSDIYLGQDENGGGTALLGFNAGTYQADNPYYTSFNIDVGDPDLFRNNIPLSGCTPPPGCTTFFNNPSIASPFSPLTIPCPPSNAANRNDEDICATAPPTTYGFLTNCNSTAAPAHSMWLKFELVQNATSFEMQVILNGNVVPNVYWELYHSTTNSDDPLSLTPFIPMGSSSQACGTNYTGWATYNTPSLVTTGNVYVYMHIYTTVASLGSDVDMNVKLRNSCPPPLCTLTASASATNTSCNAGSDGTATASPSGGTAPFTYMWNNGQTTQMATGLSAATYSVTVTDADGCTASASATVNEPTAVTAGANATPTSCNGGNDGTATANPGGGTAPYTYLWNNGQTTQTATGLSAATYTVTVTDANGCTASASTTVNEPTAVTAGANATPTSCSGGNDGTATVTPGGGTPGYTYLWSDGQTTATATGLSANTHTVTITDANGCTASASATVNEPTAVTASITGSTDVCAGATNGTATVAGNGGTPGYTYLWSNGQTSGTATGLAANTYSVTVTDANGCTASTNVTINSTPCYAIGNMVWLDEGPCSTGEGNNGLYDAGSESGINGVSMSLFRDPNADGLPNGVAIATDVTSNGGFYLFEGLDAGNYLVRVNGSNFAPLGPLNGLQSSTFTEANPNNDVDNNDNGRNNAFQGGIWSGTITLGPTEPTGESPLEPGVGQGIAADNEGNMTIDFGFAAPASIGDYVWEDVDHNGLQGATVMEPPVQGVRVRLFRLTQFSIAFEGTRITNASGNYLFDNLPGCRQYFLVFDNLPTDYEFTLSDQGGNDNIDSDPAGLTGATVPTTLAPGENDMSWDAGIFLPKASLGDYVWDDLDEDGYQEAGEPPVQGVTVVLFNCMGDSLDVDVTDVNGRYGFTDLVPGDYYVEFRNLPADYVFTLKDAGPWTTDSHDSDADPITGRTACTHLDPYENDPNWDAGIYLPKASLGDKVWNDVNEDGKQDPNEPGVSGVKVVLYTCAGDSVTATTTDPQGNYLFELLTPGDYYVVFSDIPQYWKFSPKDNVLNDDANDSDADAAGKTACTTLDPGEDERDVDAGIHLHAASISDRVWHDLNENGIQDAGEPGVAGVHVALKKIGGTGWLDTTQTSPQGYYSFDGLVPGDYCMFFYQIPTDYVASPQNQGLNAAVDSDPDPNTFKTVTTTLDPGEHDPTWDLGIYVPKASLGNRVWEDDNENGIQDAGESGVGNIRVVLYTCTGDSVDQQTTDSNGEYWFTDLDPGDYYVVFKDIPTGYVFSPKDASTFDSEDSDANSAGQSHCTTLSPGEVDPTVDAGIYLPKASLGDCVWNDANENGIQDPGEALVAGVTVTLYNGAGVQQGVQTTNLFGKYLFDNLVPGDYYVVFTTLPPDYEFTQQDAGSDNEKDSDADPGTGKTMTTTLDPGENDLSWDAGIYLPKATLGNKVWNDDNENGAQDPGESGVAGITVKLYDCSGTYVASTTTNADGEYWFTDLIPGSYYVEFSNLPTDYIFSPANSTTDANDSDANSAGQTACVSLAPGETNPTVDAGIYLPKAKLGDKVFEDGNNNGIQDPGESGVLGVKVTLYDCAGNYQTETYTDSDGEYLFDNLMPGSYYVVFSDLPFNYAFSIKDAGTNDHADSDADASGQTACVSLAAGETNLSVDAGIYTIGGPGPNGELGNRVWDDVDEDGEQDPGEPGIGNVRVVLYNCNGDSLDQQYTDGNGNYLFTNLAAGGYYVIFKDIPAGYSFSGQDQGGDDSADSDANSNGQTACVMLPPGGSNLTVDGGIKPDRVKVCEAEDFAASGHGLLFTSGTYPGTDNRYGFDSNGGEFITYANGTARLTGMLVNKSDANLKLCVELRLIKRKDWGAWSAQGGLAKGSHLGPYMTWDYYEVDSLNSFLIGKGNLAGEVFSLSHMPVNRVYGPQVGTGANDRNANYGMSGWWFFNSVSGNYGGTGDFNLNLDNCVNHTTAPAPSQLGAMALLQGPYEPTTGLMRTDLKTQGILPSTQPFNTAPWNYTGTETLGTTAPYSVVDWVLIELRDVNNPETVLSRQAGVLVRNGQLVQADGFSLIELPQNTSNFYLVIYNWNHLSVMSSQPLQKYGNVYYHDFTAGISSIYEDLSLPNQPAVVLPGGKTLLFEGDATSDELINSLDLGQVLQHYFNTGISSKDVNMDGVVNSIDVGRAMQNYFKRSHVPR